MNTKEFIVLRLELTDTPTEVWREVAIQSTESLYDLKTLLCHLFTLDEEASFSFDVDGEVVEGQRARSMKVSALALDAESSVIFTSHGADTWNIVITPEEVLDESTNQLPVTCMAGEGHGILNKDMTHELYNEIIESALLGNQSFQDITDLPLEFIGEDLFDIDVNDINTELLNTYEFREKDEDVYEEHVLEEEEDVVVTDGLFDEAHDDIPQEKLTDDFFHQETIVQFYTDVIGLTDEQAAYHVLYETSINNIIEAMQAEGYSDAEIDELMKGNHALDEELYEVLSADFDILQALPQRNEIFTEEDEERLVKVEQALFATLEESGLDFESFVQLSEEEADSIEDKFMGAIRGIDKNLLS